MLGAELLALQLPVQALFGLLRAFVNAGRGNNGYSDHFLSGDYRGLHKFCFRALLPVKHAKPSSTGIQPLQTSMHKRSKTASSFTITWLSTTEHNCPVRGTIHYVIMMVAISCY